MAKLKTLTVANVTADGACQEGLNWLRAQTVTGNKLAVALATKSVSWWAWAFERHYDVLAACKTLTTLDLSDTGGWILKKDTSGPVFDALRFQMRSPTQCGGVLRVVLRKGSDELSGVDLAARHCRALGPGWWE